VVKAGSTNTTRRQRIDHIQQRHLTRRTLALLGLGLASLLAQAQTAAPNWPDKVVRIINPYAPGGPSDTIVRMLADGLSQEFGQRVIVENKPGAGTLIGANMVAKAAPDGYTLLLATVAPLVVQPTISTTLPYDAHKDFAKPDLGASLGTSEQHRGIDRLCR